MNKPLPDLVLFDLDNTLLAGDSDFAWGVFLCDMGVVDKDDYLRRNEIFYRQYHVGELNIREYLRFALAPLAATPTRQLLTLRETFMRERIEPMITPAAIELVARHQRDANITAIITATNNFITEPIAAHFNIDHLIATRVELRDGRHTGEIVGIPCFREGKLECLRQWLDEVHPQYRHSWCYSDSYNDIGLLSWVDNPVVVDGDEQLRAHAAKRRWGNISLRD